MALSVGHLTDEVTGLSTVDPIYVGSVWGFDSTLSSEEEDEREEKLLRDYRGTIRSELVIRVGPKLFLEVF